MPKIVLASRNPKKAIEIARLLEPVGLDVLGLDQFSDAPEVVESGVTFAENAALKAGQPAMATGQWTLADDSGLIVDALNGEPGVYSARYAGENATDAENNAKLLEALRSVPPEKRTARFVCHLAVADPSGAIRISVNGSCRGRIIDDDRGTQGFGYDPLFLVPEFHRTFGQLSLQVKSQISHRARAFHQLIPKLQQVLREI
ncbi:MAG: XTP/dITP diphosphatase [Rhodopirellula sp.]|nr:XTP/dITP diphosphatase [Rhodopirellula sp.]